MRTLRVAVAATLMTLTLLTACGDGDDDSGSADDEPTDTVTETPSETTSAPPTETSAPTEVTPMDPAEGDVTQEQLDAALLTPEEIAPGLVLGTWEDTSTPPPCDQTATPADEQIPPAVQGGVQIDTPDETASMEEEIAIYASEEEASQAFAIQSGGLDCSTATLEDGSTVTIGAPTDVTAEVNGASGVGTSTAWEVTGEGFTAVLIATLASKVVMANTFFVADGADTSALPTPLEISSLAWNKALAN